MSVFDEITIILGAGFSADAGIPIRNDINEILKNLTWDKFIIHSETTTQFLKQNDSNSSWVNVGERMFVEAMINFYNNNISENFDYEEFYDYCYYLSENKITDEKFDVFFNTYRNTKQFERDKGNALSIVIRTVDYLVSDLLNDQTDIFKTHVVDKYSQFLNLIRKLQKKVGIVSIYTLNHDLLLERLLGVDLDIQYSDGFEIHGTRYYVKQKGKQIRIKYYKNKFDKPIRLFKLHGSIDNYVYNFSSPYLMVKIPKDLYAPDLHREFMKDGRWEEESCWTLYQPNFLSGTTRKILNYDGHPYYKTQFKKFQSSLKNSKLVISVGYGLQDEKINAFIWNKLGQNTNLLVVKRTQHPKSFFSDNRVKYYGEGLGLKDLNFDEVVKYI